MTDNTASLHSLLVSFFEVLAMHRITTVEVRKFLRLLQPNSSATKGEVYKNPVETQSTILVCSWLTVLVLLFSELLHSGTSSQLLCSLLRVLKSGIDPPNVEFDMRRSGTASVHIPSFGSRSWPPANGYTFLCWMYFCTPLSGEPSSSMEVDVFSFEADEQRSIAATVISRGKSWKLTGRA